MLKYSENDLKITVDGIPIFMVFAGNSHEEGDYMKGTRSPDNDEIRSLGLGGGSNFRWQYTFITFNL